MSDNINRIKDELESLGYKTSVFESKTGKAVSFQYIIETGSHKGEQVMLAISMHGNETYPEYPPHWIHVSPPIHDGKGGAIRNYVDANGREWVAMSRPPGKIWDQLPTKHIMAYMNEHLRRFWDSI